MIADMPFEVFTHQQRSLPVASVRALYAEQGWWPERSDDDIVAVLDSGGPAVGGWIGDRLVAFARAVEDGCFRAYIEDVVVAQSQQGKGYGVAVVDRLHRELAGVDIVSLFCSDELTGFYERAGYRFTRQRVGHRQADEESAE